MQQVPETRFLFCNTVTKVLYVLSDHANHRTDSFSKIGVDLSDQNLMVSITDPGEFAHNAD
jgi:hypothetical protein